MKARILLVDDDPSTRTYIKEVLEEKEYEVTAVKNGMEAIEALGDGDFDLIITDLMMPGMDGFELIRHIRALGREVVVIIMTAYGSTDRAVEAMHLGAFDFISKPVKPDLILMTVARAISWMQLKKENVYLREKLKDRYEFGRMIGYSDAMRQVFETIRKVAAMDSTVLIQGESGTGKELVARAIHYHSHRRNGLLIPVNCGAIPSELLESELFGHEKGAFTGAIRTKIGRFEMANGGTIFLDEISEMSPQLQVKLLRVLQERCFERVGGVRPIEVDIRVIAATNQNLEKAVAEHKFREDLYYRINVVPIHLPPLRERGSDIIILANHFLKKFSRKMNKSLKGFTPEAEQALARYHWPGNVRELENLIEMLTVMKDEGLIDVKDLPAKVTMQEVGFLPSLERELLIAGSYQEMVNMFERRILQAALEKTGGIKSKAARLLKIKRTTLTEKIKKLGLDGS
ncbi:MAG: sigma-54 dependent transcriptional regulator [Syntrophales bacterium]|nr:sigma-54 dependent transcriptional regulator [Syntrophales bacterium]